MIHILLIFIAAITAIYYNTMTWLAGSWIHNEYYSHGILVPIISGYLIWSMRKDLASMEKERSMAGLLLLAGGMILHGISVMWTIRFLSGLSLVVSIAGVVLYLYGWQFTRKIWFPLLFLLLMVPIPFIDMITTPAQTISAIYAEKLARFTGLPVTREGFVLTMPSGSFEIGLPCSGINSIISLFTTGLIFAYVLEGGKIMKTTILLSIIPLALAGNVLRITSVLGVANIYGSETAINYFHDISSIILFAVALAGLFFVGRCFGRFRFKKTF